MFTAQIKRDLQELTGRVDLMDGQLRSLCEEIATLRSRSSATEHKVIRPRRRAAYGEDYLVYRPSGGIDIEASLKVIDRSIYEIMSQRWPKNSAENRIDIAVRRSIPGQGGLVSRGEWLLAHPEQLELFR